MGCSKSSSKREVYSITILPQETRKSSNRQPNLTPKTTGKRRKKIAVGKKSTNLEMKKQRLQQTTQKYKGL